MNTGERVKTIRKNAELTVNGFAAVLKMLPMDIEAIENEEKDLEVQTAKAICREFNVDYFWLTEGIGEMYVDFEDAIVNLLEEEISEFDKYKDGDVGKLRNLINRSKLSQSDFANKFGIPLRTLQGWVSGDPNKKPKKYVVDMLNRIIELEKAMESYNFYKKQVKLRDFYNMCRENNIEMTIDWYWEMNDEIIFSEYQEVSLDADVYVLYQWNCLGNYELIDKIDYINKLIEEHDYLNFMKLVKEFGDIHFPHYAAVVPVNEEEDFPCINISDIYDQNVFNKIKISECFDL